MFFPMLLADPPFPLATMLRSLYLSTICCEAASPCSSCVSFPGKSEWPEKRNHWTLHLKLSLAVKEREALSHRGTSLRFWRINSTKGVHVLLLAASCLLLTLEILSMSYQSFSFHVKCILFTRPSGCSFCLLYFLFLSPLALSWIFTVSLLHFLFWSFVFLFFVFLR